MLPAKRYSAYINLPGMNVLVKRAADDTFDGEGCIPLSLGQASGYAASITEDGSTWEKLRRKLNRANLPGRLSYQDFDVVITLPKRIGACVWTKRTNVQHEAYRTVILHTDMTEATTLDLPAWPTLLVPNTTKHQNSIHVYSRSGVDEKWSESPLSPIIRKGRNYETHGRLCYIYFPPERAVDHLVDGYAAVVCLPQGARLHVRSGTPYTNGMPGGAVTVTAE